MVGGTLLIEGKVPKKNQVPKFIRKAYHSCVQELSKKEKIFVVVLFFFLTVMYCLPLIVFFDNYGRGDWDVVYFYREAMRITVQSYHQFPLWNPWHVGGISMIGNLITRYFSPFLIFEWTGVNGLRLEVIFHSFMSLNGMYFLCRKFSISSLGSFAAAIIFAWNGFFVSHFAEGHVTFFMFAYLPVLFYFLWGSLTKFFHVFSVAIVLTMIFLSGGQYSFLFSVFFAVVLCTCWAIEQWSCGPIRNFLISLVFTGLFSAPKLLPCLELMALSPRLTAEEAGFGLNYLFMFFFDRSAANYLTVPWDNSLGWWEFAAYIGVVPAVLFLMSFNHWKKRWPMMFTGLFFFFLGAGNFSCLAPWRYLHMLPIFCNSKLPSRSWIIFIFILAFFVGLSIDQFSQKSRLIHGLLIAIVLLIAVDLFQVNVPVWRHMFSPLKIPKVAFDPDEKFVQFKMPAEDFGKFHGRSSMWPELMRNRGITNGYEPIPFGRHAVGINEPLYNGESYLKDRSGKLSLTFWSPNNLRFSYDLTASDKVIVNQNYDRNWHSNKGDVASFNGLISIDIPAGMGQLELWYFPYSILWGCVLSVIGIATGVLCVTIWRPFFERN